MANDFKMQPDELQNLHAQASDIQERDAQLGNMLHALIHHLGHAFGLDANAPSQQEADAQSKPDAKASTKGQ